MVQQGFYKGQRRAIIWVLQGLYAVTFRDIGVGFGTGLRMQ